MSDKDSNFITLNCQVTAAEYAQIDAIAQAVGQTPSDWLYAKVKHVLNQTSSDVLHDVLVRIGSLERKVVAIAHLEQQVAELVVQLATLQTDTPTQSSTADLPAKMPGYKLHAHHLPTYRTNAPDQEAREEIAQAIAEVEQPQMSYEDIEDEPDEVLYEFLDPRG